LISTRSQRQIFCAIGAALIGHPYWTIPDAARKAQQKIHFFKDVAIIGGLLFVFCPRRRADQCRPALSKAGVILLSFAVPGWKRDASPWAETIVLSPSPD